MRVRYATIEEPAYVLVQAEDGERTEELWPVMVDLHIEGKSAPLRFAWDRWHRVLYVDERWRGRALLGDEGAAQHAAHVAKDALRRAAERALKG